MSTMTDYLNLEIEDDVIQEADENLPTENTGAPDSLVDDVSGETDEKIEPAEPMEALPPIHNNNESNDVPESEISNDVIMSEPKEESEEKEKPPADAPISDEDYEKLIDDGDSFDPSKLDINKSSEPTPESSDNNVPDTTPSPEDKDQGEFEGPMKYVPLYQRRNEDDLSGFGSDYKGDTPANQYDMNEVNAINVLISSEASAVGEYTTAAKESKNNTLQRLYSDIANEERFHLEQLMYAKSQITGEIYIPHDPDIKNEYKELLAMGMDEETAMTTAVDKVGLMPREVSDEEMVDAAQEVLAMKEYYLSVIRETNIVLEHMSDGKLDEDVAETIQESYNALMEIDDEVVMESVGNIKDEKTINPFVIIGKLIAKIYAAILTFIKKVKSYINKIHAWNKKNWEWIKANGIKGLFADGLYLYFYNEKIAAVDYAGIATYITLSLEIVNRICEDCNTSLPNNFKGDVAAALGVQFQPVTFRTIEDGVDALKKMLITKTKLIVNDANEASIEALFFGISKDKMVYKNNGRIVEAKSNNIFHQYEHVSEVAAAAFASIQAANTALENLVQDTRSVYYTNRTDKYDPCLKFMQATCKAMQKLVTCITSDTEECMKVNNRLYEITKEMDSRYAAANGRTRDIYAFDTSTGQPVLSADDARSRRKAPTDTKNVIRSTDKFRL